MKYINNSIYFVPRFISFLGAPITADSTYITVDSTFISPSFILELTDELTKEITTPDFEIEVLGSFVKIIFDKVYSGNFSVNIYNHLGTIYKGRFASECNRTEIINDKMYL